MNLKKIILLVGFWSSFGCSANNRIYVNSIPKCGTHMATWLVEILTGFKPRNMLGDVITNDTMPLLPWNEFPYFHVTYSQKAEKVFMRDRYRCIFMYRDPRDHVVSFAYWTWLRMSPRQRINFPELINTYIDLVDQHYRALMPWVKSPCVHAVRYENLVGARGGGSNSTQLQEIKAFAQHIGVKLTDAEAYAAAQKLWGHRGSFREGKIGSWRDHFTEAQKKRFKQKAGIWVTSLGYEKSNNW